MKLFNIAPAHSQWHTFCTGCLTSSHLTGKYYGKKRKVLEQWSCMEMWEWEGTPYWANRGRGRRYERGTEWCVLQAADTAGAEPVADQSLIYEQLCHEDVLGEQTYRSSHS